MTNTNGAASMHALVSRARAELGENESLWERLVQLSALLPADLAEQLKLEVGVEVLADASLARAEVVTAVPYGVAAAARCFVRLDGAVYQVEDDPWSADAALARVMRPDAPRAVLAKPGQVQTLVTRCVVPGSAAKSDTQVTSRAQGGVVDFVDRTIARAREFGASDIHFECNRSGIDVKFRLDGVMVADQGWRDPVKSEEIISRIKVLAQLDITERRRPQDGRMTWSGGAHATDLRVSIMPSIFGEDAVLRILDRSQLDLRHGALPLNGLGFDTDVANALRRLAMRPHGMVLVTGPTGSGKTTTVYGALSEVNNGLQKIVTIEDPVEYELAGVLQIPVNEQKGLTFASGLRSILRHDPDTLLVGEIRDDETAEIAVQSALTGHLVFTTVHANSLFDVLGRFRHFGLDPFALGSALNGIVNQRLLRKVCPHCADRQPPDPAWARAFANLGLSVPAELPVATGCPLCRSTGYRGRSVVAEIHVLDDTLRDLLVQSASTAELRSKLQEKGKGLVERALAKVADGVTTIEEVERVVGLD